MRANKEDNSMQFGDRLTALRDKRGLKQEELANFLGISRAALSHYEKNRRKPDYDTLNKIANFFKVPVDFLVSRSREVSATTEYEGSNLVDQLELLDEALLERFLLAIDGKELSAEDAGKLISLLLTEAET
jgi:transcriptional regulator with XRE-family HTH domain